MKVQTWSLTHQKDEGTSIRIRSVPLWAVCVEALFEDVDTHLGHALCGSGPEWMWRVPAGWPRRAEEGHLENSLGAALHNLASWFIFTPDRHETDVVNIPVNRAQVEQLVQDDPLDNLFIEWTPE